MSWALRCKVANPTRKLVLIAYADHAWNDGTKAYIGTSRAADVANCDVRTVQRHVAWLVEHGYMREGDQGAPDPRKYRADRLPIVYDLAMSDERQAEWAQAGRAGGVRSRFETAGAKGAASAQARRGDILSPRAEDAQRVDDTVSDGATVVSPRSDGDGVTVPAPRGDSSAPHGVTVSASRGDSGVTQERTNPTPNPTTNPPTANADGATPETGFRPSTAPTGDGFSGPGAPTPPPEPAVDPAVQAAERICRAWVIWWEASNGSVVTVSAKPFLGCRGMVASALGKGYREEEIKTALTRLTPYPSVQQFQRALGEVRSGRPAGRRAPANPHRTAVAAADPAQRQVDEERRALFGG
jgi:hypothetical protein